MPNPRLLPAIGNHSSSGQEGAQPSLITQLYILSPRLYFDIPVDYDRHFNRKENGPISFYVVVTISDQMATVYTTWKII